MHSKSPNASIAWYGSRVFCHQKQSPHLRQSASWSPPPANSGSTVKIEPLNLIG